MSRCTCLVHFCGLGQLARQYSLVDYFPCKKFFTTYDSDGAFLRLQFTAMDVQVRLAHQVLHKVVARYLRRDNLLASSIKRLAELAKIGREALMNCDIDELGDVMMEAWRLHQELDPYCSNELVDRLFTFSDRYCRGYKLIGAGGGGFALLLARNAESAKELRRTLAEDSSFDVKVYDWDIFLQS